MSGLRVVVTGIGVVSPIGNNLNEFWQGLSCGKNGVNFITRFDTSDFKAKLDAEIKDFNPLLAMNSLEVKKNDLYSQYALVAANEAVIDSDILNNVNPERLGVYVGSGLGGLNTILVEVDKLTQYGPKRVSPYFIPMMISNIASGSIAIKYNAQGVNLPIISACSTGTNAIGEAYRAIKYGYADAIITGGAEAPINKIMVAGFQSLMALSNNDDINAASIPFDARRNGFVIGEGAGILILEEYQHAVKRNAKIYAEICGYGNNCDAYHMTAPNPSAESSYKAIFMALQEAGYSSGESLYINAHGTSTVFNDKSETLAIKRALGEDAYKCMVSSTKSMTGHMLGAAGAVEAIASIFALKNSLVPPTINYLEKDPECDLDYVPNIAREKNLDITISNSLGFGGHNACIAFRKV